MGIRPSAMGITSEATTHTHPGHEQVTRSQQGATMTHKIVGLKAL